MAGIRFIALAALILIGMVSYALIGQAIGAFALREFRDAFRRRQLR
jgi:putative peptidoglycan lipid II flippase